MIRIRISDRLAYKIQRLDHIPLGFRLRLVLDESKRKTKLYYLLMR